MPRETYILTQDIAEGQIVDFHPKVGSRLRKLVDKKVIDPLLLLNVSCSGLSKRLDLPLLDQPVASLPDDIGILVSKQHSIFIGGSDKAIPDAFGKEVRGNLSVTAAAFDTVLMTLGSNVGVATTPGVFEVGDIVRIPAPPLSFPYIAEISAIAWPNLTFVDPGTPNPAIFLGPTGPYTMERITRFLMSWVDSVGGAFALPFGDYDIGVMRRIYLSDVSEDFGSFKTPVSAEAPDISGAGGGGGAGFYDESFTPMPGQTVFTLSQPCILNGLTVLDVNGIVYVEGVHYTVAGTTLTWMNVGFSLDPSDLVTIRYQIL